MRKFNKMDFVKKVPFVAPPITKESGVKSTRYLEEGDIFELGKIFKSYHPAKGDAGEDWYYSEILISNGQLVAYNVAPTLDGILDRRKSMKKWSKKL